MKSRFFLALALLCGVRAHAQAVGATPDGEARAVYARHAAEYAQERRAMVDAGGRVSRVGGRLRLRFASGRYVTLTDTLAEGDRNRRFVYVGFRPAQAIHIVAVSYYEGGTTLVYHDRTGQRQIVAGLPAVSPDGRRFASASMDLEAGYDPNRLEIWRVDPRTGLRCEAVIDGGDEWGPDSVEWVGPDTVRFTRVTLIQRTLERRRARERITRTGAGWVLASSSRRLTNRCN